MLYKNIKQMLWKCGAVQIVRNDSNTSKFDSGGNEEGIEFG
jgi:hypothetical protein